MFNEEQILEVLRKVESVDSQRDLSDKLGYSVGKVNYIINALVDKGFIQVEKILTVKNKKKYRYLLTVSGIKKKISLIEKFIMLKEAEYNELRNELEILRNE